MIIPLDGCRMIPVLPECALSFLPFIIPALSDRQPTVSTGVLHLCLRHHIQASEYDWRSRCSSVSTIRIVSSPQEATEAIGIGPLRISARSPSYDTYGLYARHVRVYSVYSLLPCSFPYSALLGTQKVIIRAVWPLFL